MNEERMRILKMIEAGQISAEEGAKLLEALEPSGVSGTETVRSQAGEEAGEGGRAVRIRVFDAVTGREKINLAVPIGFAKMLSSLLPEAQRRQIEEHGFRLEDVIRSIESGKVGKIVDIDNKDQDEKIEITIE